jgi:hypothetical protein
LHVEEGYTGKLCYVTIPGGVPGNSFALSDVDVVCSKETATGLPRFEKGQDRPSCKQWERKRLTINKIISTIISIMITTMIIII